MSKIVFNCKLKKQNELMEAVLELRKIQGQIKIDIENDVVEFENVSEVDFIRIYTTIKNYFLISSIQMDNIESIDLKNDMPIVNETKKNQYDKVDISKSKSMEEAILVVIDKAINKIDTSNTPKEEVDDFLRNIGMSMQEPLLKESFLQAFRIKKISMTSLSIEMSNDNKDSLIIQKAIKNEFRTWLSNYPELLQKYPNISIITLIKVYVNVFNKK